MRLLLGPPQTAVESAAIGEALFRHIKEPILGFTPEFVPPTVSIGYFQSWKEVPDGTPFVRRLTGGGLIDIAGGYSVASFISANHPRFEMDSNERTLTFNSAVALALCEQGIEATVCENAPDFDPESGESYGLCFKRTYRFDLEHGAVKIAASSTFKTNGGVLQDIAIRWDGLNREKLTESLVNHLVPLFGETGEWSRLRSHERLLAEHLYSTRYSTAAWNRRN